MCLVAGPAQMLTDGAPRAACRSGLLFGGRAWFWFCVVASSCMSACVNPAVALSVLVRHANCHQEPRQRFDCPDPLLT